MASSIFLSEMDCKILSIALQRKRDATSRDNSTTEKTFEMDPVDHSLKLSFHNQPEKITNEVCTRSHVFEKKVLIHYLRIFQEKIKNPKYIPSWMMINSNSYLSELPVDHTVKPLNDLLTLQKDQHLMAKPLEEALNQIDPLERLLWIIELLIDYHQGLECREFLSIAIRLCLKGYELSKFNKYESFSKFYNASHYFVKMLQKNNCVKELSGEVLKLVFEDRSFSLCFIRATCYLKTILKSLPKSNWSVKGMLNRCYPEELQIFDLMFDHQNFVTLVEFGAFSDCSAKHWNTIKTNITTGEWFELKHLFSFFWTSTSWLAVNDYRCIRFHQVGRLFNNSTISESSRRESEYLLNLLWAAIADPFLTREDLEFCVNKCPQDLVIEKRLEESFHWYKNILMGRSYEKTPRSLKHLCRIKIRKTLSLNFQLPDGVQSLMLPNLLKSYLLLKDCGVSPFNKRSLEEKHRWLHTLTKRAKNDQFW